MAVDGIIDGMEDAHSSMVNWLVDAQKALTAEIGPRPFGMDGVPERTQIQHGALIWEDPNAWTILLQSHGWQGPGTPLPKAVVKYGERLFRLSSKYPDDFKAGLEAAAGHKLMDSDAQHQEGTF